MNEPRGKSHYSVRNQIVKDGLYCTNSVQWLNRQAAFKKKAAFNGQPNLRRRRMAGVSVNLSLNYLKRVNTSKGLI